MPTKEVRIRQAIREKRLITFEYSGKERTFQPYALGQNTLTEELLVCGNQTQDETGPRKFNLEQIKNLRVLEKTFRPVKTLTFESRNLKTLLKVA